MTVSVETVRYSVACDGETTSFSFPQALISPTDMQVYLDGALALTGYVIAPEDDGAGGTILFEDPPADGTVLLLVRRTDRTQDVELKNAVRFPATSVETALDRLTLISQELSDGIFTWYGNWDAAVTYPAGSVVVNDDVLYIADVETTDEPPSEDWTTVEMPEGPEGPQGDKGDTGEKGDTGDPAIVSTWAGAWSISTTYSAGDLVSYGGQNYLALAGSTGDTPPSANWQLVIAGATGLDWEGTWVDTTDYVIGDCVTWEGASYVATADHSGQEPPNASYWDVLAEKGADGAAGAPGPAGAQGSLTPPTGDHYTMGDETLYDCHKLVGTTDLLVTCMILGPDNRLWVGSSNGGLTGSGGINRFELDGTKYDALDCYDFGHHEPSSMAVAPDGKVWANCNGLIFKFTVAGSSTVLDMTKYQAGGNVVGEWMLAAPDDRMWFTRRTAGAGSLVAIDPDDDSDDEYAATYRVSGLAVGDDDRVWTLFSTDSKIGAFEDDGTETVYSTSIDADEMVALALGGDGRMWVALNNTDDQIAAYDTSGNETIYDIGRPYGTALAQNVDGRICLYCTESTVGYLLLIDQDGSCAEYACTGTSALADFMTLVAAEDQLAMIYTNTSKIAIWTSTNIDNIWSCNADAETQAGSTAGTLSVSMPQRGAAYKMVIITLNGWDSTSVDVDFPQAFNVKPALLDSTGLTIASWTTQKATIPNAGSPTTGTAVFIGA